MSTPVATVADALISFILSLLRDPAAVEEFDAAPKAVLASKGLQDACAADVQAVKPIIVDNPTVIVKPAGSAAAAVTRRTRWSRRSSTSSISSPRSTTAPRSSTSPRTRTSGPRAAT